MDVVLLILAPAVSHQKEPREQIIHARAVRAVLLAQVEVLIPIVHAALLAQVEALIPMVHAVPPVQVEVLIRQVEVVHVHLLAVVEVALHPVRAVEVRVVADDDVWFLIFNGMYKESLT